MRLRAYDHDRDDAAVHRLLLEAYPPGAERYDTWLPPRWEYMHAHSLIDEVDRSRFGVAEDDDGRLLGIVHNEHHPAFAYLQRRPGDDGVIEPLLDWAEAHLGGWSVTFGRVVLGLYVPTCDRAVTSALVARGYARHLEHAEPTTSLPGIDRLPAVPAPAGTRLQTLAEHTDLEQVHRVLWRGFDHDGPPPPEGLEERRRMHATSGFRPELTVVTVLPDGTYTAFCGVWLVLEHRLAYVEPVATDPDHRRKGHGRAVVLEALRRAGKLGAEVAWVGSDQPFYLGMGFQPRFDAPLWTRSRSSA